MTKGRWKVVVSDKARRFVDSLGSEVQKRITAFLVERLESADEPEKLGKALTGKLVGLWRFRVGDYRLIGKIERNRLVILIIEIDHRREIYR